MASVNLLTPLDQPLDNRRLIDDLKKSLILKQTIIIVRKSFKWIKNSQQSQKLLQMSQ